MQTPGQEETTIECENFAEYARVIAEHFREHPDADMVIADDSFRGQWLGYKDVKSGKRWIISLPTFKRTMPDGPLRKMTPKDSEWKMLLLKSFINSEV
jgi:tetraacyldisaccharide-1-P 4'-kinase